jgi:hypothetical protein
MAPITLSAVYSTRTAFANNQQNEYLVSELQLVVEDCRALQNDIPALQKHMRDRQIMTTAIMQVKCLTNP